MSRPQVSALMRLRAYAFAAAFYVVTALFLILGSPLLFAPRSWAMAGLRTHARTCLLLQRLIAGTSFEVRGREHLPDGAFIVAAKHQSAWETFALIPEFRDPAIVLKEELLSIPLYGAFCKKFEHIAVRRDRQAAALKQLIADAKDRAQSGRELLIFPEGTRRDPGMEPDYKPGYLALYANLDLPLVPVALNSGVFWPARTSLSYPGRITVEFGKPIPPGLARQDARIAVINAIENRTAALVAEATSGPEAGAATALIKTE